MRFKKGDKIIRNKEVAGALTLWNFSFAQKFEILDVSNDGNYVVILDKSTCKREFISIYQVDRFYDLDINSIRTEKLLKITGL